MKLVIKRKFITLEALPKGTLPDGAIKYQAIEMRRKQVKRLIYLISLISILSVLSVPIACLAGDVPEALQASATAQVYFGEVIAVEESSITTKQVAPIKGDFEEGAELVYTDFSFTIDPQVGEVYLCGYLDENNPLYLWEVTSYDPKTLKIKQTDNMSKRMETYLNAGDFDIIVPEAVEVPQTVDTAEVKAEVSNATQIHETDHTQSIQRRIRQVSLGVISVVLIGLVVIGGWRKYRR